MKYFITFGPDFITPNALFNYPRLDVSTLGRFDLLPYSSGGLCPSCIIDGGLCPRIQK